jgi:hypothetical protein
MFTLQATHRPFIMQPVTYAIADSQVESIPDSEMVRVRRHSSILLLWNTSLHTPINYKKILPLFISSSTCTTYKTELNPSLSRYSIILWKNTVINRDVLGGV